MNLAGNTKADHLPLVLMKGVPYTTASGLMLQAPIYPSVDQKLHSKPNPKNLLVLMTILDPLNVH